MSAEDKAMLIFSACWMVAAVLALAGYVIRRSGSRS